MQKKPKQDELLIRKAYDLFDEFYSDTLEFRKKCIDNEEFYRANHWANIPTKPDEPQPVTPVLFSTIESLLGDIMDAYPEPIILGEEEQDDKIAGEVSDIINYIIKRRRYRSIYRDKCRQALKKGVSVQEVYWDTTLYNGLGDINIRQWDILNFLWDPKSETLQDGRAVFKFGFYTKEYLLTHYPFAEDLLKPDVYTRLSYIQNTACDDDVMIMDYWYKEYDENGLAHVHMAKLCGHVLLENSKDTSPYGMQLSGKYPFVMESPYPLEGQPIGFGIIDLFKNLQIYADKLDQIILKNALMSSKLKLLVNRNSDIDEGALNDWSKEIIKANRIDDSAIRWFQPASLNPYVLTHYNSKLEAIKEESGQTEFTRGESGKGVTAASAILALQEAGSKRSRMLIDKFYDGFEELIRLIIDLICENYTEQRRFRITGEKGSRTVCIKNTDLMKGSKDLNRFIDFDINIAVQKQTPYKTLYQNELALELLKAGIIVDTEALSMMTFTGKDALIKTVKERKELMQQQQN